MEGHRAGAAALSPWRLPRSRGGQGGDGVAGCGQIAVRRRLPKGGGVGRAEHIGQTRIPRRPGLAPRTDDRGAIPDHLQADAAAGAIERHGAPGHSEDGVKRAQPVFVDRHQPARGTENEVHDIVDEGRTPVLQRASVAAVWVGSVPVKATAISMASGAAANVAHK